MSKLQKQLMIITLYDMSTKKEQKIGTVLVSRNENLSKNQRNFKIKKLQNINNSLHLNGSQVSNKKSLITNSVGQQQNIFKENNPLYQTLVVNKVITE